MDNKSMTQIEIYADRISKIVSNLTTVIVGKDTQIELLLAGLLSGGHILLEDIPGTGKTTLVKALAYRPYPNGRLQPCVVVSR